VRDDDPESLDAAGPAERGPRVGVVDPAELERARRLLAATASTRRSRQLLGSRRRQAFAAAVLASAVGFIAFEGLTSAAQYYLTTKQATEQRAHLGSRPFRIEGIVANDVRQVGSLTDFDIYGSGVTVPVASTGSPPQLFKPGVPVVLVGHWQGDEFASDQIMVKHTAQYTEDPTGHHAPAGGTP
jgi:cytochrome c-type biogenesis protein CcmE